MNNTNQNGDIQTSQTNVSNAPYGAQGTSGKKNSWLSVIIAVVAVIVVAIITTVVVIEDYKRDMHNLQLAQQPAQNAEAGSVLLNGEKVHFKFILENGKTYLPVEDLAKALNYKCIVDNNTIKIVTSRETYVLEVGSNTVNMTYHVTTAQASTTITTSPFISDDGKAYIYVRDLAFFMADANVSYDSEREVVLINIEADSE